MRSSSAGAVIARVLAGAWRPRPPALDVSEPELAAVSRLLLRSGAGALAWWRLRHTALERAAALAGLHQAYLLHTLDAEVHVLKAAEAIRRLRSAGIDALLVKGWAIARRYPELGLRQYTDVDLVLRPGVGAAARAALAVPAPLDHPVDLHDGPSELDTLGFDDLADHAETLTLHDETVRVPGPEDHLRILALHALRHSVFRPLWLVDLAVAIETRPAGFDWGRCLGSDPRRGDWVVCALALAQRLLGAQVDGTPVAARATTLPGWLVSTVLRRWTLGEGRSHRGAASQALASRLGRPRQLWAEARFRWDRPIEATMEVGGAFDRAPRWPYQVAATVRRLPEFVEALRAAATTRRASSGARDPT